MYCFSSATPQLLPPERGWWLLPLAPPCTLLVERPFLHGPIIKQRDALAEKGALACQRTDFFEDRLTNNWTFNYYCTITVSTHNNKHDATTSSGLVLSGGYGIGGRRSQSSRSARTFARRLPHRRKRLQTVHTCTSYVHTTINRRMNPTYDNYGRNAPALMPQSRKQVLCVDNSKK